MVCPSRDIRAAEAWVGVGSRTAAGDEITAAVVHLVRFGSAADAPLGGVGTRGTNLIAVTGLRP